MICVGFALMRITEEDGVKKAAHSSATNQDKAIVAG